MIYSQQFFTSSLGLYCPTVPLDAESSWECRLCQDCVSAAEIRKVEIQGREIISKISDSTKVLETISKLLKLFSQDHHLILLLKMKFVLASYTDRKSNQIKVNFAKSILPILDKLEGGKAPSIGQVARELVRS